MDHGTQREGSSIRRRQFVTFAMLGGWLLVSGLGQASAASLKFIPGDLIVSSSIYTGNASTVIAGQALPGGGMAIADGTYPDVFENAGPDGSFGVTSPIYLKQYSLSFNNDAIFLDNSLNVTALTGIVTSFSSKSELSLHISTNKSALTFMGYDAPLNTLDVSNSNTPNHVDPTNPVAATYQRAIVQFNTDKSYIVTPVNSYSGNNGRGAILNEKDGQYEYFMVGNAGNGSGTPPVNIVDNTGVQLTLPNVPESIPVGILQGTSGAAKGFDYGYSVVQQGDPADKSGKDNNYRGLTIFDNTLYVTKGSGSNGIDTVYQVGYKGVLPDLATASAIPFSILYGFTDNLAANIDTTPGDYSFTTTNIHPFGLWFANATTLYVADEGDGVNASANALNPHAGLQKWSFVNGAWTPDYVIQGGLDLGVQYSVAGLPSTLYPATDGLRNIAGKINGDGTVTIFAITSTISNSGDQGADPNKLVAVTDRLDSKTLPMGEKFKVLKTAEFAEVLRGVAIAP